MTIAIPAGAAHDADGAASLEPIIVDNTVTDHGACTPVDVLTVINWINSHPAGAGEGEAAPSDFAPVYAFPAVSREASGGVRLGARLPPGRIGDARGKGHLTAASNPSRPAEPLALTLRKRPAESNSALDADLPGLDSVLPDITSDLATGKPGLAFARRGC